MRSLQKLFSSSLVFLLSTAARADVPSWSVPGDGQTPTFLQYLDGTRMDIRGITHLAAATPAGALTFTHAFELPPAILTPELSLSYSSLAGPSLETVPGWVLSGLVELRRPTERAFDTDEWRLSGPQFQGTLQYDSSEGRYVLLTSGTLRVVAEYDPSGGTWTVQAGGVTYTLEAVAGGSGAPQGPALYRGTSAVDVLGNRIDYSYASSDGRLTGIQYGGNDTVGAGALVSIEFDYGANTSVHTTARAGYVTEYAKRVEQITIGTRATGIGVLATTVEPLATFTYSEFDESLFADGTSTIAAPRALGASTSESEDASDPSESSITMALLDFNRDGLSDLIDATSTDSSYPQWDFDFQTLNHTTQVFSWDTGWTFVTDEGKLQKVVTSAADGSPTRLASTHRRTLDLDGDGYLDLLISDNPDEWVAYYGNSALHYSGMAEVEAPPTGWTYSQVRYALNADDPGASTVTRDIGLDLIDFNGDGWLDAFDPHLGKVWLHSGERGGGWGGSLTVHAFDAIRSVAYVIASEIFTVDAEAACQSTCETGCANLWDDAVSDCTEACESECFDTGCTCPSDCEEICWDSEGSCDELEWVGDCAGDCSADCEDIEMRSHYVSRTFETKGFYDINGDGLPDYVDASTTPRVVDLGNGSDFEDGEDWNAPLPHLSRSFEGRPDITWDGWDLHETETGEEARVYLTLLDVDGDGLLDLAAGEELGKQWWRNTGSGFSTTAIGLPIWWPDDFVTSESTSVTDADEPRTDGNTVTTSVVMDLDHDGALDYVTPSSVSYGVYPRPYLLIGVDNGQGGTTDIDYRSAATLYPSGMVTEFQDLWTRHDVVSAIETADAQTGEGGTSEFEYSYGVEDDGVFQGFEFRSAENLVSGSWLSTELFEYELTRDFDPLVTLHQVYTDSNLTFAPSLSRGAPVSQLRKEVELTYGLWGSHYVVDHATTRDHGEVSGTSTAMLNFTWDSYGNLIRMTHDGGGVASDAVLVELEYSFDADETFSRLSGRHTTGTDPVLGTYGRMSSETFPYDEHSLVSDPLTSGLLSESILSSGWAGGGEALNAHVLGVTYERGTRGEPITVTDTATGETITQTFGFGASIVKDQANSLGHTLSRTIDAVGRVTHLEDDNGVIERTLYDNFGRPAAEFITGATSAEHKQRDFAYQRTVAPFHTRTRTFDDTGAVDTTTYEAQDGLGRVAQTWRQQESGDYNYENVLIDARGLLTRSAHPASGGATYAPTALTIGSGRDRVWYDGMGVARETIADEAAGFASELVYKDEPGVELRQDAAGYQTRIHYDALHRVTWVEQGKNGMLATTARYVYDAKNQLLAYTDGNGNIYAYSYDGAGRLRAVRTGMSYSTLSNWYTYTYDGQRRVSATDSAGGTSAWTYDDIGRPLTLNVSDPLPFSPGVLQYSWTYDTAWVGAVATSTDPTGTTTYAYDDLGRSDQQSRLYTSGVSSVFTSTFDLAGRLTGRNLPSGQELRETYSFGWLSTHEALTGGTSDYSIAYEYNQWGKTSRALSSLGHDLRRTYTTPMHPDRIELRFGTSIQDRDYTFYDNGLLATKTSAAAGTRTYSYDTLRRLTQVSATGVEESFAHDAAGNLTSLQEASGAVWTYSPTNPRNHIPGRTRGGFVETYTYDAAGRMTQWKTNTTVRGYSYDGLGRRGPGGAPWPQVNATRSAFGRRARREMHSTREEGSAMAAVMTCPSMKPRVTTLNATPRVGRLPMRTSRFCAPTVTRRSTSEKGDPRGDARQDPNEHRATRLPRVHGSGQGSAALRVHHRTRAHEGRGDRVRGGGLLFERGGQASHRCVLGSRGRELHPGPERGGAGPRNVHSEASRSLVVRHSAPGRTGLLWREGGRFTSSGS